MTDRSDTVSDVHASAIKYVIGGLGGALLSCVVVFIRHFLEPVYDTITMNVPQYALVQITTILAIALLLAGIWILLLYRERQRPLTERYPFEEYGGYYVEPTHGWALCPNCLSHGRIVHMMDVNNYKKCNACECVCHARPKK